ncbi:DUF2382 domain-containing protein [Paractinoplanes atraurantiacus]|uniref:PRC-barrel domain-containing protein n=1 Tax=Paractinoplanes atraurantiacus TaxID=1036182 RepID=A0A285I3U5_9ACTN|nr:PRC and DUF2382 domain-containing protein [Actinoplanes atraurantiacus]SNY42655.1 PRC-barrel domain-containing protein [Actinoplanes atraurantiacus]
MAISQEDLDNLSGAEVYDKAGRPLGTVGQIYLDPHSGEPLWVTVRTGAMSFQESFVPLRGAGLQGGRLTVAVDGTLVRAAPMIDTDGPLEYGDADRLEAHYGSAGDDAMTRSEERLVTGVRKEPVTKVRLRKHLVTEERQITVPVTREEVHLERVPVDAPDVPAPDTTLYAERPVVTTEKVPVERVRLRKQTVTDEETVTAPVHKEQIEFEGPS